jgi:radical SAM superfamily enzyme YgiQ (UPF0313 family)
MSNIDNIEFDGLKQVKVGSPAITPYFMEKVFPHLKYSDDLEYDFMIRCDRDVYTALKDNLNKFKGHIPNLKFRFGIEFPSDRMLQFMNKGTTVDGIIEALSVADNFDTVNFYTLYMLNWPNLIQEDIESLKDYITRVSKVDAVIVFKTFFKINTPLYDMYKHQVRRHVYEGDFYRGYFVQLTEEQFEINAQAWELMKQVPANWRYVVPPTRE